MKFFVYEPAKGEPEIFSDVDAWADKMKKSTNVDAEKFRVNVVQSVFHNGVENLDLGGSKMYVIELPPFLTINHLQKD